MDNKEYKIDKITDFLEVPEDRIDDCLAEFATFLEFLRAILVFAKLGAETQGMGQDELYKLMGFTWVDNGKEGIGVRTTTE